jgi:hypothetical protein
MSEVFRGENAALLLAALESQREERSGIRVQWVCQRNDMMEGPRLEGPFCAPRGAGISGQ